MKKLLKPPKLNQGDTIGVVATSLPFPTAQDGWYYEQYLRGASELEAMGFRVKLGKNVTRTHWWCAGTPQERADDINAMFADSEVKAVIVHNGGQSAIATLDLIDYELVSANPKPFMGFSDVTNHLLAMFTKAGLVGFHMDLLTYGLGGVWKDLAPAAGAQARKMFYDILTSSEPVGARQPLSAWQCWQPGAAEGMLFGGNLSMMSSLAGTRFFPRTEDLEGCILFWEIDNTASYRIERDLYQLKYAGVLDVIVGMVVGKLPDMQRTAWLQLTEPTPREIVAEVLKDYRFPILAEVDFGHKSINTPMPIGLAARIDAESLHLEVLEAAVV